MGSRRSDRLPGWNRTRALWPTLIGALFLRDRGTCAYCGAAFEGRGFQIDHVRPEPSRMKRNDPRNLVCSCGGCNARKGDGPVPAHARAEVRRRTRRVLDMARGRAKALELYPWHATRSENRNAKRRRQYTEEDLSFDPADFAA